MHGGNMLHALFVVYTDRLPGMPGLSVKSSTPGDSHTGLAPESTVPMDWHTGLAVKSVPMGLNRVSSPPSNLDA